MKNTNFPLISVIVTVYNIEAYLEECLQSIIGQTYQNLEIILVDDGSADKSASICDIYAQRDPRIKVIHKSNGGLVKARKTGILKATGFYATYVDGDDWLDSDAYECLISAIDNELPDIIAYGMKEEYPDKTVVAINGISAGYYSGKRVRKEIYPYMLYDGQFFCFGVLPNICAKLVRREILLKCQLEVDDEIEIGEDVVCTARALLKARSVMLSDFTPYHYRKRYNSMMANQNRLCQCYALFINLYKLFSERHENKVLLYQLRAYLYFLLLLKQYECFLDAPLDKLPFGNLKNCRIALYGAGGFGHEIYNKTIKENPGKIVLWVDRRYELYAEKGYPVAAVENLKDTEYDIILIAVLNIRICREIENDLVSMGIAREKIKYVSVTEKILDQIEKFMLNQNFAKRNSMD